MTGSSLAGSPRNEATEKRREATERFEDASEAYFLLAESGCAEERLRAVAQVMARSARVLRGTPA